MSNFNINGEILELADVISQNIGNLIVVENHSIFFYFGGRRQEFINIERILNDEEYYLIKCNHTNGQFIEIVNPKSLFGIIGCLSKMAENSAHHYFNGLNDFIGMQEPFGRLIKDSRRELNIDTKQVIENHIISKFDLFKMDEEKITTTFNDILESDLKKNIDSLMHFNELINNEKNIINGVLEEKIKASNLNDFIDINKNLRSELIFDIKFLSLFSKQYPIDTLSEINSLIDNYKPYEKTIYPGISLSDYLNDNGI